MKKFINISIGSFLIQTPSELPNTIRLHSSYFSNDSDLSLHKKINFPTLNYFHIKNIFWMKINSFLIIFCKTPHPRRASS